MAVHGIAPNDVDAVAVVDSSGARHQAELANNAFYFEHVAPDSYTEALVLTFVDGREERLQGHGPPPSIPSRR